MEKQPQRPMMGALETQLSFEEAQSLCAMEDMPVEAFSFTGGGAPGAQLAKSEWRGCALKGVCLRGADLRGAYFRDVSFLNCDFAGAALIGTTLHRCAFEGCRLTGANFSAGALADVRFFGCVAQSAVFSECGMKAVRADRPFRRRLLRHWPAAARRVRIQRVQPCRRAVFAHAACGAQLCHLQYRGHLAGGARTARRARHSAAGVRAGKAAGRHR